MWEYWREHPPVHELVATFMGMKSKSAKTKSASSSSLLDFARDMGANGLNGVQKKKLRAR